MNTKSSFLVPRQPSIDRRNRPVPDFQVNLFHSISEEDNDSESEKYSNSNPIIANTVEGALIYLRMRPTMNEPICNSYTMENNVLINKSQQNLNLPNKNVIEKHFTFTDIFPGSTKQATIYETCVQNKIQAEENFTLMTYGTSGSGKTFTLIGDLENPGILPRVLEHIFEMYANNLKYNPSLRIRNGEINIDDDESTNKTILVSKQLLSNCHDVKNLYNRVHDKILSENNNFGTKNEQDSSSISIWISFIEIYNEVVYDLLEPDLKSRKPLKVITNNGKVFIKNLTSVFVQSSLEGYKLLTYGLKRVSYASTGINTNSSRSHCIFFVDIIKYDEFHTKLSHISYKFCDLAGSERLCKTGNVGSRLKEAQRINTSLMVLGRCLDAASNNHNKKIPNVIPIRESKLTMILQAPLLGNEKITMIVNITPTEQYYEENLNVLGFSSIAKNIYYKACEQKPKQTRFSWFANTVGGSNSSNRFEELYEENISLQSENERLQTLVIHLEKQLEGQEKALRKELVDNFEEELRKRTKRWNEDFIKQEKILQDSFQAQKESLVRYYTQLLSDQDDDIQIIENGSDDQNSDDENANNIQNSKENVEIKKRRVESL